MRSLPLISLEIFSSSRRDFIHRSCLQVSVAARYSASVVDSTTSRCRCNFQLIGPDASFIKDPDVDRLVEGSAAKSASEYASRIGLFSAFLNFIPLSGSWEMYRRTLRAA